MNTPSRQTTILDKFDSQAKTYEELGQAAVEMLKYALSDKHIQLHSVTHRAKSHDSLAQKLARPEKDYSDLEEVTDLCGVRVITYFDEEVDEVAKIIDTLFTIDVNNSPDKRKALEWNRFGYQSLHFVVSLLPEHCALPQYRRFADKKLEIQVRSILQHAWAEIEHDLGYKSVNGVPHEIRRRFARVAGLLELADVEFTAIRADLRAYENALPEKIQQHPETVALDLLSLKSAFATSGALKTLDRIVCNAAHARLTPSANFVLERALPRLAYLNINSIAMLEEQARRNKEKVEAFAKQWMSGDSYASLEVGVGTTYLCYLLVGQRQDRQFAIDYLTATSTAGTKLREKMADNILGICAKIGA